LLLVVVNLLHAQHQSCPGAFEQAFFPPTSTDAVTVFNAAQVTIDGSVIQASNAFTGGAIQDEDAIDDFHFSGCSGMRLGVANSTNGVQTAMYTDYSFSTGPIQSPCFKIFDIDRNDELIINVSHNGNTYIFGQGNIQYTLLDQNNSCITKLIAQNAFTSTCTPPAPNINNSLRGGMQICVDGPVDNIELIFYDKGTTTGGSYTFCELTTCAAILPIELNSFDAISDTDQVMLSWETASELNLSHFEIQKSRSGEDFQAIGSVDQAGGADQNTEYAYADASPRETNYYRLAMIDLDGSIEYSKIIFAAMEVDHALFPNPIVSDYAELTSGEYNQIVLTDLSGRVVRQFGHNTWVQGEVKQRLDFSSVSPGSYFLQIVSAKGKKQTLRVVKGN